MLVVMVIKVVKVEVVLMPVEYNVMKQSNLYNHYNFFNYYNQLTIIV
jgi:hypothetical protein